MIRRHSYGKRSTGFFVARVLQTLSMNTALKHLAENLLVTSGVGRVMLRTGRDRTLVLAYHNILPDGESRGGNSNLHLPQPEFARQLDALAVAHDVVPIDDLLAGPRRKGRPRVVITFDDAYAGCLTAGVHELERRGMPACIFVAPALLGAIPWWDTLADPGTGSVPEHIQQNALIALRGEQEKIVSSQSQRRAHAAVSVKLPRIGSESQLVSAASVAGITLGSHAWSHPNLCRLTKEEVELELRRPLEWLHARFKSVAPWLTYPYGLFDRSVETAVERAGYQGAFRIDGGWMRGGDRTRQYALPRFNVPFGLSINGFKLRLAGF